MSLTITDEQRAEYEKESQEIIQDTLSLTGFSLDKTDPTVVHLILQRRAIKQILAEQNQTNDKQLGVLRQFFDELQGLLPKMRQTAKEIGEKGDYLKNENEIFKSFREQLVEFAVKETEEKITQEITPAFIQSELKNAVGEYIRESRLKTNLILGGVFVFQLFTFVILLIKVLK